MQSLTFLFFGVVTSSTVADGPDKLPLIVKNLIYILKKLSTFKLKSNIAIFLSLKSKSIIFFQRSFDKTIDLVSNIKPHT